MSGFDIAMATTASGGGSMSNCVNKETCIEYARLGENTECYLCPDYKAPMSNADRIRAMDDKEISVLLSAVKFRRECFIKIPDFLSIQDAYKWLQQPAEEADHESNSEP